MLFKDSNKYEKKEDGYDESELLQLFASDWRYYALINI